MLDIIGFDADDTLWNNEPHYSRVKNIFTGILARYQDAEQARRRLDEIEVYNLRFFGYGMKSFTLSMIQAAIDLSAGQISAGEIGEIIEAAKGILSAEVDLIDGAQQTLAQLAPQYDLMLITKGDPSEQESKIVRSGLAHYFRYIEIVGDKTEAIYAGILKKYSIDPACFLMVGNSLRSDILPVLRIGAKAVYIPNDHTWFHEHASPDELSGAEVVELESLSLLADYLERAHKQA